MRRALGIPFHLLAILLLAYAQVFASMAFHAGEPLEMRLLVLPVLILGLVPLFAALALAPGGRLAAAGLSLMISAGLGALLLLLLLFTVGNPALQDAFEPGQRMKLSWAGLLLSLALGVCGWLLRRAARRKAKPSPISRMYERLQAER